MSRSRRAARAFPPWLLCAVALAALGRDVESSRDPSAAPLAQRSSTWVGAWEAAQLIAEADNAVPRESLADATLRQVVHLSAGGSLLRLRVSNAFGTGPLHLSAVHVARPVSVPSGRIEPASDRAVTFNERADVVIPAGAQYTSDPLEYPTSAQSDLAITMQVEAAPDQQTGHPMSLTTSYLAKAVPASAAQLRSARAIEHWYFLSGVEVSPSAQSAAIVAFGDSITDGHASTANGNDRWPDVLAARLHGAPSSQAVAVLNAGIAGNRLLTDGFGPNALARLDRDVLAQSGVRYLIVLEGINDIGMLTRDAAASQAQHQDLVRRMIGAYRQITLRAHEHGIKVIGATVLPFMGSTYYHPGPASESDRQIVNAWIRAAGHFDAVIDFDRIAANPGHPQRLRPDYDCGDHLHPSPAGYRALAESIPLQLFQK